MTLARPLSPRACFLLRVASKASRHLADTDRRLFASPFTQATASRFDTDPELAERVEAFVGRFSRLQDTLGDKLLPALLAALAEPVGAAVDNLDRAERLGLIASADDWQAMRALRNQMVHEYVEDPAVLVGALQAGHDFTPALIDAADRMFAEAARRGWG